MDSFLNESVFFGVSISLIGYSIGRFLEQRFKNPLFNPLLISIIFVIGVLLIFSVDYEKYSQGAAHISFLLTPATVCLGIPLFKQIELLKRNAKAILIGVTSGVVAALAGIFAMAKAFGLDHQVYVTLLPKSITTAIGIGVSEELGGIVTISVATILMTGILGNVIGEFVCKIFRIKEPIAKGLALGTASHAIGTARAMEMGEVEGAMSSLAIVTAGLLTVVGAGIFSGFI